MSGTARVSVIGLGDMGHALASALLDSGREVVVWNRTAAKADDLVERGAVRAGSIGEAVRGSSLLIVCLLDYDVVRQSLRPVAGELRGRTLVNLTNGTPAQAAETAVWVTGLGADYLDGGIMAIPSTVASPEAFVFYSGERRVFDAHQGDLEVMGAATYLGTDVGLASLYDLALLSGMEALFSGFHQAVAMAVSRTGGSAVGVTEHVVPWFTNMIKIFPALAADIDAERADGTPARISQGLDVQIAGVTNMVDASRDAGADASVLEHHLKKLKELTADGHEVWTSPLSIRQLRSEKAEKAEKAEQRVGSPA
ncbi:NAD(P)-dependent oxidoreductase [Streptomyces sp. NPDC059063]|uniref:NAD(P)-dependent oxidoreductase n=1 Tax=unclassified Streptomyces TaxID=2593676 RepID=UPI0036B15ACD